MVWTRRGLNGSALITRRLCGSSSRPTRAGCASRAHTELFHECGATRVAGETAVVFPRIRTASGDARFPFCVGRSCTTYYGEELRPISSLMIAPSPTSWAYTTANDVNEFAVLRPVIPDQSVSVSAPLASGTISTVSVPIPAIE